MHVLHDDELSAGDLRVYCALDYLAGKRGWFYDSLEQIATVAGVSRNTAYRAVQKLRERDYISTVGMGLEHQNVLRYAVHARTIPLPDVQNGDGVVTTHGYGPSPRMGTPVITKDGDGNTTDVPINLSHRAAAPADEDDPHRRELRKRAIAAWETQAPGGVLKPIADWLWELLDEGTPIEWIERACVSAAENGGHKPKNYVLSTLQRYRREGIESSKRGTQNGRRGDPGRSVGGWDAEAPFLPNAYRDAAVERPAWDKPQYNIRGEYIGDDPEEAATTLGKDGPEGDPGEQ